MENLKDLNSDELMKINGGGWLADIIAQFITDLKCGCEGVIDGDVARSGVGSIVR